VSISPLLAMGLRGKRRTALRTRRSIAAAAELHRLTTNDAAEGSSAEKAIQNIETNVPPGTHWDEAAIDVVLERPNVGATVTADFPAVLAALRQSRGVVWAWTERPSLMSHAAHVRKASDAESARSADGGPGELGIF
jgi:hypothetical protein